jgi:hypothetical protein
VAKEGSAGQLVGLSPTQPPPGYATGSILDSFEGFADCLTTSSTSFPTSAPHQVTQGPLFPILVEVTSNGNDQPCHTTVEGVVIHAIHFQPMTSTMLVCTKEALGMTNITFKGY